MAACCTKAPSVCTPPSRPLARRMVSNHRRRTNAALRHCYWKSTASGLFAIGAADRACGPKYTLDNRAPEGRRANVPREHSKVCTFLKHRHLLFDKQSTAALFLADGDCDEVCVRVQGSPDRAAAPGAEKVQARSEMAWPTKSILVPRGDVSAKPGRTQCLFPIGTFG